MQHLATAEQMQRCDRQAITRYSLPGIVLMENAGRASVDVMEKHAGALKGKRVMVVCGKGNNGGDGFVIARHLANRGANVQVGLLCRKKDVKGDAKTNLDTLLKMVSTKESGIVFDEIRSRMKIDRLNGPDIVVDAIFGTGFSGEVRGLYKDAIRWINGQNAFVVSIDIPSGVSATTGIVENMAVQAHLTVTMGLAKIGHYVGAGRDHSGTVEIVDISIPSFVLLPGKSPALRVQISDVRESLPRRPISAHKNSVGKVFVLAGSSGLTGAPFMTAQSAMRTGSGAVILGVPKSIHSALIRKVTEVMVTPLEETPAGSIALAAMNLIRERVDWADVLAIGPGLSMNEETQKVIHQLLETVNKPVVLDADGINAMAEKTTILRKRKYPTIITPHIGELKGLIGLDPVYIEQNRVDVARSSAKKLNCTVCLKGAPTATGTLDGSVYVNPTGNPGMATAGAGDVLTGIIASLLSQGMTPEQAAYCGVFIHGMSGDKAAKKYGQRSLLALDILDCIPETLKEIEAA